MSIGLLLVGLGLALRVWAWEALRKVGLSPQEIMGVAVPRAYTQKGPYRWMSHPAYLGSLLVIAGGGVLALGPPGAVLALAAWPFFAARIHEENRLRGRGWL